MAILKIDRSTPFDPTVIIGNFLAEGWGIVEEDERATQLTEIDLARIQMKDFLDSQESYVPYEKKTTRLKNYIGVPLDAKTMQVLWENQQLIPEHWKEKIEGLPTHISFDGTLFHYVGGDMFVMYMFWNGDGWIAGTHSTFNVWRYSQRSAMYLG